MEEVGYEFRHKLINFNKISIVGLGTGGGSVDGTVASGMLAFTTLRLLPSLAHPVLSKRAPCFLPYIVLLQKDFIFSWMLLLIRIFSKKLVFWKVFHLKEVGNWMGCGKNPWKLYYKIKFQKCPLNTYDRWYKIEFWGWVRQKYFWPSDLILNNIYLETF